MKKFSERVARQKHRAYLFFSERETFGVLLSFIPDWILSACVFIEMRRIYE